MPSKQYKIFISLLILSNFICNDPGQQASLRYVSMGPARQTLTALGKLSARFPDLSKNRPYSVRVRNLPQGFQDYRKLHTIRYSLGFFILRS
jgi:hypothetical protein